MPGEPSVIGQLRCLVRGQHEPVRQVLGGFRCASCGEAGRDLAQMGFPEIGYVKPQRYEAPEPPAQGQLR